jgi:hypothetical protein
MTWGAQGNRLVPFRLGLLPQLRLLLPEGVKFVAPNIFSTAYSWMSSFRHQRKSGSHGRDRGLERG